MIASLPLQLGKELSTGQDYVVTDKGFGITRAYAYLFARKKFFFLNRVLFHLALRGLGFQNYHSQAASGEDHFLKGLLKRLPSPTIFDVGANEGDYSARVKELAPSARVLAFEPHPSTFQRSTQRLSPLGVEVINAACGREQGTLELYDYSSGGSERASLYPEVIAEVYGKQATAHKVEVLDLDTFAVESNIEKIDLLKIDTEGHELEVLAGAKNLLAKGKIDVIQFEFNEMNVFSRTFFHDFQIVLESYNLYRLVRDGMLPLNNYSPLSHEIFGFQNIVAIRKGLS